MKRFRFAALLTRGLFIFIPYPPFCLRAYKWKHNLGVFLDIFVIKLSGYVQSTSSVPWQIAHFRSGKMIFLHSHFLCESVEIQCIFTLR